MKKFITLSLIVCLTTVLFAFMKDKKIRYDNLKVLSKNTTKQEMDSVMRHFSQSLGVKCTYCHVRGNDEQKNFDFASDANNNKLIARDMMRMMAKINKKYFKESVNGNQIQAVSCYSCHHGQENPGNKPPAPERH